MSPLILGLSLAAAGPVLGPSKTFGDWAVACDNVKRCAMTSLLPADVGPADDSPYQGAAIFVFRDAGGDALPVLEVAMQRAVRGPIALRIDGAVVGGGVPKEDLVSLTSAAGARAVAALAAGKAMAITDTRGATIARVSLAGSSAALRFIDAEQGRAGGVTAIVAKGAAPASAVPPASPLPTILHRVPPPDAAPPLAPALLKAMLATTKCDEESGNPDAKPEVAQLDTRATLVLLPCGSGAYNTNSVPFVLVGGKPAYARFDSPVGWGEGSMPMLVNGMFEGARLSSYSKGRGLGDCGSSETFVWDGAMFRLVDATTMGECRGSVRWLTVWRAQAVAAR